MSRMFTIAVREYLAFVRTVGFWLSICLMPAGLLTAIYATSMTAKVAPPPNIAVADLTGGGYVAPLEIALRNPTDRTLRPAVIVAAPGAPYVSAAAASQVLRPTSPAKSARRPAPTSTTR
jgi:ABC-2 type transport system permease protein